MFKMNNHQELLKIEEEYEARRNTDIEHLEDTDNNENYIGYMFFEESTSELYVCHGRINGEWRWVKIEAKDGDKLSPSLNRDPE
jgi:hypothetical protein